MQVWQIPLDWTAFSSRLSNCMPIWKQWYKTGQILNPDKIHIMQVIWSHYASVTNSPWLNSIFLKTVKLHAHLCLWKQWYKTGQILNPDKIHIMQVIWSHYASVTNSPWLISIVLKTVKLHGPLCAAETANPFMANLPLS